MVVQLSLEVGVMLLGKLNRQENQNCKLKSLKCEQRDRVGAFGLHGPLHFKSLMLLEDFIEMTSANRK